jgi:hypothetical protein
MLPTVRGMPRVVGANESMESTSCVSAAVVVKIVID